MLNYIDRSVLFSVQGLIQKEFKVSDAQIGFLTTTFFFFYIVAAPFVGSLGDLFSRHKVIATGIFFWSGFTLLTAITHTYNELLIRHVMVGVGEASYAAIAPTLIADLFPLERRGRMLSIFNVGLPVGVAIGYILGGKLGDVYGWRMPFMLAGVPGFLLAVILWMLPEPERGQHDPGTSHTSHSRVPNLGQLFRELPALARNGAFLCGTLGLAMYTFAMGGLQVWMPVFLTRVRELSLPKATSFFGTIVVINGIVATLIGGWTGDRMLKKRRDAYYVLSGVAMLIAVPLMVASIYQTGSFMFPAMFAAVFFLLLNTGPLNTAIVNSVGPGIRATALAVNIFIIHLLGDVPSPTVIGKISDKTHSLQKGFSVTFIAAALSGVILLVGARYAPRLAGKAEQESLTTESA
ncbi:MAG TPA: MFS transporter [Candidatus Angelobacter sp.]|nr:MFS transporter [Candidatus Angelobacter sp.]